MADTYSPGFSKERLALERFMGLDSTNKFNKNKRGTIGKLKAKSMGSKNGLDPIEEVYSLTPVDFGEIEDLSVGDVGLQAENQKGVNALGEVVDVPTLGSGMNNRLCNSSFGGSFAVGKDGFRPTWHRKSIRWPMFCVDEAQVSPKETIGIMNSIYQDGYNLAETMLDWNLWEQCFERATGNTSIAEEVVFAEEAGLPRGSFPFLPKSSANHEFFSRIKEKAHRNPYNAGKKFMVKMSEHQIQRCIEHDQRVKKVERRSIKEIVEPFRTEPTFYYDGIYYVANDTANYVGTVKYSDNSYGLVRPKQFIHQAGNVHGTVARTNTELDRGSKIEVDGYSLDKYEVAEWYFEDSLCFVPWKQNGSVPTSGAERLKDQNYNSLTSFKPYWVAEHEVTNNDGTKVVNDRNQFQQLAMEIRYGLFFRPDVISSGYVLMAPVHRNIVLETENVLLPDERTTPDVARTSFEEDQSILRSNGETSSTGSTDTTGGGIPLSENPGTTTPDPAPASDEVGKFRYAGGGLSLTGVEQTDTEVKVVMRRVGGTSGAASIDLASVDGTAITGTNYTALTATTLSWADGEGGDKFVTIALLDDDITENKQFTVVASSAVGATAPVSATATITIEPTP